jgi:HEAT repeat protein
MRILAVLVLALAASGCSKPGPTLAGGRPIEAWVKALQDPDAKTRKIAALKLGNVGPAHPTVFPALHDALKDRDAAVRCEVILALVKFGPDAKDALPALGLIRKNDPNAKVRDYAAKALQKLDSSPLPN